jgi:hypothetical protein
MDSEAKETESVLLEAAQLVTGPRREAYGPVEESFKRIATVLSVVLSQKLTQPLTPRDVALIMVGLKLCRETNAHGRDNCVDGAAYFAFAETLAGK